MLRFFYENMVFNRVRRTQKMMRLGLGLLTYSWAIFSASLIWAEDIPVIDLSQVESKETVDRREDLSPQAWRMAVFFARDTSITDLSIGHAYVALLTFREDTESFVTDGVFGLYPDKDEKFSLGKMPGGIDLRPLDERPDSALLVWINPAQHQAIEEIAQKFEKAGEYQLLLNDCVSLMSEVATAAGLTKSPITLHPWAYVNDLMFLNN
ncbi:hypothetical protein [Ruegeria sp. HKCCA0235A]|uniref:hypothetical protein n=1 Tax=Ruegeria sp. HKCCA0235A TaxID=2682998 RepID=UPI001487AF04|nr:hypothetical protein [Ruegeria sp. HKCCA0235A]